MAIATTNLVTDSTDTDATSYTTASFLPTASSLLIAAYDVQRTTSNPTTPTVSGGSLTWELIAEDLWADAATDRKFFIYAAQASGSPSSMAVTFDHGATTMIGAEWSVFQVTGSDVANGVVQCFVQVPILASNTAATSATITLNDPASADNRPFMMAVHAANETTAERANWTPIGTTSHGAPNNALGTQWRSDVFETTASASWSTSAVKGAVAWEIKAGAASSATKFLTLLGAGS